jgi:integrase
MGVKVRERPEGSGVWWVFIDHQGKRKAKKIGEDKELALEFAKKAEAKLILGDLDLKKSRAKVPIFGEYSQKWLAFIKMNRRESTYERYNQVLNDHILPVFKKRALDAITRGDIRDFLVMKSAKFSVFVFRDVLSGILGFALDDELIKANPVSGITKKLGLKRDKSNDVDPMTEMELSTFLDKAKKIVPEYYPFFLMAARTGMRIGELIATKWGDLDFNHSVILEGGKVEERPFIWVKRTYRRGRFTPPKNGKSRKVDMSSQLKAALQEHLTTEKKKALKEGWREVPELVFHRGGKVIEQNYIRRVFKRVLSKAKLKEIKFHGVRHTFASLLLSMGESPVYVKEQLGHHSIQITVDIYGKWIQTKREAGVNKLDDAIIRNLSATTAKAKAVTC